MTYFLWEGYQENETYHYEMWKWKLSEEEKHHFDGATIDNYNNGDRAQSQTVNNRL